MVAGVLTLLTLGALIWSLEPRPPPTPVETAIQPIPLTGPEAAPDAELSGLAWFRDQLVLLPQYPERFATEEADMSLLRLARADIEAAIDGEREAPLALTRVPLVAPELEAQIPGFD